MAEPATLRRRPLEGLLQPGPSRSREPVSLAEIPFLTMVSVRLDPHSDARSVAEDVLGVSLPLKAGQVSGDGSRYALWLGPDEWLIVARTPGADLVTALELALQDAHVAIVDVSSNRAVIELSGPDARSVLQKGCSVDLHPRAFGPGTAVATALARVPLVLWQTAPETYLLLPGTSFATYVACWLQDAMREFVPAAGARAEGRGPRAGHCGAATQARSRSSASTA